MQVLSYDMEGQSFFVGLSLNEFEEILKNHTVKFNGKSNYEYEKQRALRNMERPEYVEMIKNIYDINEYPFICVVIDKERTIKVLPAHYPFAPLWNGYSPWQKIKAYKIKDLSQLEIEIRKTFNIE